MAKGIFLGGINKESTKSGIEVGKYYYLEGGIIPVPIHSTIALQGVPQDQVIPMMGLHIVGTEEVMVYDNFDAMLADWEIHSNDDELPEDVEAGIEGISVKVLDEEEIERSEIAKTILEIGNDQEAKAKFSVVK